MISSRFHTSLKAGSSIGVVACCNQSQKSKSPNPPHTTRLEKYSRHTVSIAAKWEAFGARKSMPGRFLMFSMAAPKSEAVRAGSMLAFALASRAFASRSRRVSA